MLERPDPSLIRDNILDFLGRVGDFRFISDIHQGIKYLPNGSYVYLPDVTRECWKLTERNQIEFDSRKGFRAI